MGLATGVLPATRDVDAAGGEGGQGDPILELPLVDEDADLGRREHPAAGDVLEVIRLGLALTSDAPPHDRLRVQDVRDVGVELADNASVGESQASLLNGLGDGGLDDELVTTTLVGVLRHRLDDATGHLPDPLAGGRDQALPVAIGLEAGDVVGAGVLVEAGRDLAELPNQADAPDVVLGHHDGARGLDEHGLIVEGAVLGVGVYHAEGREAARVVQAAVPLRGGLPAHDAGFGQQVPPVEQDEAGILLFGTLVAHGELL